MITHSTSLSGYGLWILAQIFSESLTLACVFRVAQKTLQRVLFCTYPGCTPVGSVRLQMGTCRQIRVKTAGTTNVSLSKPSLTQASLIRTLSVDTWTLSKSCKCSVIADLSACRVLRRQTWSGFLGFFGLHYFEPGRCTINSFPAFLITFY